MDRSIAGTQTARARANTAHAGALRVRTVAAARRFLPYASIALAPALILAPWFTANLDRDEGAYITVAMGVRHGLAPYADLFDHKPPLIYVVYWLGLMFDGGLWAPRVFAAVSLGATGIVVTAITGELGWARRQALLAGGLFALSLSNVLLQVNANTEAFLVLPMSASVYVLLRGERTRSALMLTVSGALIAIAVLFKTSAAPVGITLFAYLAARHHRDARHALAYLAGAAAPLVVCVVAFASFGAWGAFFYANVTYNRLYGGTTSPGEHVHSLVTMPRIVFVGGFGFWLLAIAGAVLAARRHDRAGVLLLLWLVGCYAGIKATGRDSAHYYVQLLPVAALLVARCCVAIASLLSTTRLRVLALGCATMLVGFQLAIYASHVATPAARAEVHSLYPWMYACESPAPQIGDWVRAHTSPSDRVYNLGRDTEIYYYADRLPSARLMYDRPFSIDPATAGQAASDLLASPPALIVDTFTGCTQGLAWPPEIASIIATRYVLVAHVAYADIYAPR